MYQTYYSSQRKIPHSTLSAKLEDPSTAPRTYWSILNGFLSNKKISIIPPILVDDRVVSNFAKWAKTFNSYFASQSQLPSLKFETSKMIEKITFTDDYTYLIIKNPHLDKAHWWDNVSIQMIQHCGKSIALSLSLVFQSILNDGVFRNDLKKINIVPCHKEDSKNSTKNHRPISLLPFFSKMF